MNDLMNQPDLLDTFVARLRTRGITSCELRNPDGSGLRLRFSDNGALQKVGNAHEVAQAARTPALTSLRSDAMGIFTREHPLMAGEGLLLDDGPREVAAGEPVGFLRDGELLHAVTAPSACRLVEVCVQDGDVVGYGQVLYLVAELQSVGTHRS